MVKKGFITIAIALVLFLAVFLPPFAKYQELSYKNRKLERQLKALQKEAKKLAEEKKKLETDITYIESKARERIGVVKKGEIVIKEAPKK